MRDPNELDTGTGAHIIGDPYLESGEPGRPGPAVVHHDEPEPFVEPYDDPVVVHHVDDDEHTSVLRVPTFSPLSPLMGGVLAWGAIAIASAILERVGVPTGLNLGLADGGPGQRGSVGRDLGARRLGWRIPASGSFLAS